MVAKDLNNTGLRGWAAAMSTITIILWLYCALGTFYKGVWCGELFFAPGLEGWNEREALKKEARRRSEMLVERPDGLAMNGKGKVSNLDGGDASESRTNGGAVNGTADGFPHATGWTASAGDAELLEEGTTAKEHRADGTYAVVKGRRKRRKDADDA